jgi:hypothetical protein
MRIQDYRAPVFSIRIPQCLHSVGGLICTVGGLILGGPAFLAGRPRPGASIGSDAGGADMVGTSSCAGAGGGGGGTDSGGAAPVFGVSISGEDAGR